MASFKQIPWYNSLQFQGILVFASIVGWLTLAIALAMHTLGKQVVSSQAEISLEQLGNNAVTGLSGRLQEIASLTRAIATTARELPADEVLFQQTIPDLLHFDGDLDVAGGGIWPEPFQFDPGRERASFFWGRDAMGRLTYYDDYNLPGPGYHNEAWYVTAQHIEPGTCSWSESYMDPYSLEPMVTCTVGIFQASNLKGAATVDLNLRGLKQWASEWQDSVGGYLFVVDRNNRFITFPESDWVRHINVDSEGNQTENYLLVENLAATNQDFAPINEALNAVNETLLTEAEKLPEYDPSLASDLDEASYQINNQDARLLAAALADPFDRQSTSSYLLEQVAIPNDPVLQVPATAFIFHVPDAYWKIVLIKSNAAIVAPANQVTNWLLLYVLGATLVAAPLGYWALKRWLIKPIADMTADVEAMAEKISVQDWQAISKMDINPQISHQQNEIGLLHRVFNTLAQTTADKSQQLQSKNLELSQSLEKLTVAQGQLVQAEKMSSLGQLVAGIAHEINNPVNFIHGNLEHAEEYTQNLMNLLEKMEAGASQETLKDMMEEMDLDFVKEDLPRLLASMETGTRRIREIVLSLRNFSRLDEAEVKAVDIHQGLDSTLTILSHRTKAHSSHPGIQIVKCYGDLPSVECYPGPLNQVFMNLLSNALDALEEKPIHGVDEPSKIAIRTEVVKDDRIQIHIQDNGPGISPEVQQSVFKYLFTTKPAGKGTGLGLTISRDIVESKHEGHLSVSSTLGEGTTFTIELPVHLHAHQADSQSADTVTRYLL